MPDKKPVYITTTIPYVNADPHIGFALEVVQADALARYYRLMGYDVFFNQGADEHGQKIWEAAQKKGGDVQTYVDRYAASVEKLKETLNLSNDTFIRTTDPAHKAAAGELWRRCEKDIEKRKFKGLYCVGCEKYLTKRDLDEHGKCPIHPNLNPAEIEEENYFFKLSNYQSYLEDYLSKPGVIVPEHRREEALNFVKAGLEDFSISREKEKLSWGVPVPGDDSQVMYVWFDALTNYISTLGWPEDGKGNYKKFWEEGLKIQMGGKDQVRFQSIMWPAMLRSAGLPSPDQVFYHGFITSDGQRMSKSLGNVIAPYELVERYGVDATRYLLLRHVHPTADTDVTWERLDEWYTANLVNGLGNLVARLMTMAATHLSKKDFEVLTPHDMEEAKTHAVNNYKFNEALDKIFFEISLIDAVIEKEQLYKKIKSKNGQEVKDARWVIAAQVALLYQIAYDLEPFMPDTSEKILDAVKQNKKPETLFPRLN